MNFLKNLFGGGGGKQSSDVGIYVYVRPRGCEEVIQIRLNPNNDLSRNEDGKLFVRKIARGSYRCFNPIEMTLYFNDNRQLVSHEIDRAGEVVDEAAYNAWQETLAAKKAAIREQNAAVDAANNEAE